MRGNNARQNAVALLLPTAAIIGIKVMMPSPAPASGAGTTVLPTVEPAPGSPTPSDVQSAATDWLLTRSDDQHDIESPMRSLGVTDAAPSIDNAPPPIEDEPVTRDVAFELTAVGGGSRPVAMINGRACRIGAEVAEGWIFVRIQDDRRSVVLEKNGQKVVVRLDR